MQKVGSALGELSEDARVQVMRWAMERFFPQQATSGRAPAPAARPAAPRDATLDVDGLDHMFVEAPSGPDEQPTPTGDEPLESMVKGFVEDFQRIARDWQGA